MDKSGSSAKPISACIRNPSSSGWKRSGRTAIESLGELNLTRTDDEPPRSCGDLVDSTRGVTAEVAMHALRWGS